MARNTGPRGKIARKFKENIFGNPKFDRLLEKKDSSTRQRGSRPKKLSEYGMQLREKQKVRAVYGVLERQFRNYFKSAAKRKGVTGEILLQLLERRLDNVVFRLGFSSTRAEARQMVSHRHIRVNGKRVNIPSYSLSSGDEIALLGKLEKLERHKERIEKMRRDGLPPWLEYIGGDGAFSGRVVQIPIRDQMDQSIQETLIVELYSK